MFKKSGFVTFSGTDGAGKSTQISILKNDIISKGGKCYVLWARGGYTNNFEFLKNIIRYFFKSSLPPRGVNSSRTIAMKNPFISKVWLNLAIFDLCFYWIIYLRIKLIQGNFVICDRFIEDTKLDFMINFPDIEFEKMILWRILKAFICKADFSFLLYISAGESIKRSKLKNEPFPDDYDTLTFRLNKYLNSSYFDNNKFIKIKADSCIKDLSLIINNYVKMI